MSEKSFVTLASRQCPICGDIYETGELLFDTHLKKRFDQRTVVGWGMCPECHKHVDDGFVAFVELKDNTELKEDCKLSGNDDRIQPTGKTAWIKKSILPDLIGEDEAEKVREMAFVSEEIMDTLETMMED